MIFVIIITTTVASTTTIITTATNATTTTTTPTSSTTSVTHAILATSILTAALASEGHVSSANDLHEEWSDTWSDCPSISWSIITPIRQFCFLTNLYSFK